ncbi:hypothetical protein EUZ85_18895 [Hahella sp. KA22]|uniref:hypothetical protein n=1 Tax=Hahella sp. KA22 TaxID=1628392 RepID=UPI000FDE5503|nr:hypothetical protein [Hahella sp. KA22]AZZ92680.1 hypothetical protein ENC22_16320 [Hahella sp. KA22]QAY56053.1 hypothetical protein EUZ85_18895 [Hahella sp. KA22]
MKSVVRKLRGLPSHFKGISENIISAILIAIIFGLWNDYLYKVDRLSGRWKVEFYVENTEYNPYKGMTATHEIFLIQNGLGISGLGEKVAEETNSESIAYHPSKRSHSEISGTITYKFFSDNLVDLTLKEDGLIRKSSTFVHLVAESSDSMSGTFFSTAANSKGAVSFKRIQYGQ